FCLVTDATARPATKRPRGHLRGADVAHAIGGSALAGCGPAPFLPARSIVSEKGPKADRRGGRVRAGPHHASLACLPPWGGARKGGIGPVRPLPPARHHALFVGGQEDHVLHEVHERGLEAAGAILAFRRLLASRRVAAHRRRGPESGPRLDLPCA